jgi:BtpA family
MKRGDVTGNHQRVFGEAKPVIAMVHLGALPGSPLYDSEAGLAGLVEGARKDLFALQAAGFDAIIFGNENDRPYELKVDGASSAAMAFVIGHSDPKSAFRSASTCCGTRSARSPLPRPPAHRSCARS